MSRDKVVKRLQDAIMWYVSHDVYRLLIELAFLGGVASVAIAGGARV